MSVGEVSEVGTDEKKKKNKGKGTGKRNKGSRPLWAVPEGGVKANAEGKIVLDGYDCNSHLKLKPTDFSDPLDYGLFEVWYFEQRLAAAMASVEEIRASGATPEERSAQVATRRQLAAMKTLIIKQIGAGGKSAAGIQEILAGFLSKMQGN